MVLAWLATKFLARLASRVQPAYDGPTGGTHDGNREAVMFYRDERLALFIDGPNREVRSYFFSIETPSPTMITSSFSCCCCW